MRKGWTITFLRERGWANTKKNLSLDVFVCKIFCFNSVDVTRVLECLKYSLNSMVLCYDLSLCSKITAILFGFCHLYFTEICVSTTCTVLLH